MTRKPRTPQPSVTDGFTIVELVIVVGLLIIISFIAVNSYLGTQRDTEDIRTRQVLELAAARGEEAARFNQRRFPDNLHTAIASGTQINATDGESTGPTVVSAVAANDITAVHVAKSESDRCWVLVDSLVSPNRWGASPRHNMCRLRRRHRPGNARDLLPDVGSRHQQRSPDGDRRASRRLSRQRKLSWQRGTGPLRGRLFTAQSRHSAG